MCATGCGCQWSYELSIQWGKGIWWKDKEQYTGIISWRKDMEKGVKQEYGPDVLLLTPIRNYNGIKQGETEAVTLLDIGIGRVKTRNAVHIESDPDGTRRVCIHGQWAWRRQLNREPVHWSTGACDNWIKNEWSQGKSIKKEKQNGVVVALRGCGEMPLYRIGVSIEPSPIDSRYWPSFSSFPFPTSPHILLEISMRKYSLGSQNSS